MEFSRSITALAFLASTFIATAYADDKQFSVGGGVYNSTISADGYADDDFSGFALTGTAAFNNYVGARLNMFWTEHDDMGYLESSGYDALLLAGYNLINEGFKVYAGAGLFSEEWEFLGYTEKFKGTQLSIGGGYNWKHVTVDFSINFRDASDYEDFLDESISTTSSLLSVGYRF
jgi:hypothetical protein